MELYTRSILVACCAALNKQTELQEHLEWMFAFIEPRSFANAEMLELLREASTHLDPGTPSGPRLEQLVDLLSVRLERARSKKS